MRFKINVGLKSPRNPQRFAAFQQSSFFFVFFRRHAQNTRFILANTGKFSVAPKSMFFEFSNQNPRKKSFYGATATHGLISCLRPSPNKSNLLKRRKRDFFVPSKPETIMPFSSAFATIAFIRHCVVE
jgi:hypothetical protein